MAPITLFRDSMIPRDVSKAASLSTKTTTILQPISHLFHRRNAQDSTVSHFATLIKRLLPRQQTQTVDPSIIPTTYGNQNNSPSPGTVVGIVLGSVAGFLLVLWLIYTCATLGRRPSNRSTFTEEVVYRDGHRKSRRGSRASARPHSTRRVSETVEVRRHASPSPVRIVRDDVREVREVRQEPRRPPPVERVVVEESREVRRSRERSPTTSGGGSEEVVVIEEHSPPRRSKSKRQSRDSGFRTVDPLSFGGVVGGEGRRGERRR